MKKNLLIAGILLAGKILSQPALSPYVVANTDWIRNYSPRGTVSASPNAIDVFGNIYVTGYIGTSNADGVVLKYDSLGVSKYAYPFGGSGYDCGMSIKVDAGGNAFVAGISENLVSPSSGRDYVVMKLDATGTLQWSVPFDRFGGTDEANALCIDQNGDIYVTGRSQNGSGQYNIVTLKLDGNSGFILWQYDLPTQSAYEEGKAIAISDNGNYLYVGGNTYGGASVDIIGFALHANTGTTYWTSPLTIDGSAGMDDKLNGLIFSDGDIVICGEKNNSSLDYTIAYIKGSNGTIIWQDDYDNSGKSNRATDLCRDSAGNFVL